MKKKKRKIWIWIVLGILAVLIIGGRILLKNLETQVASIEYKTYTADRGTITRTITGSGRLAASASETVKAENNIAIDSVSVQAGDAVHAGDVLAVYDADSIQERIDQLYNEIASLDLQIGTRTTRESVTSPITGRVKAIYANAGDELDDVMKEHGALALLSADERMQTTIRSEADLSLGATVTVTVEEKRYAGTVANMTKDGYLITLTDNGVAIGATAEVFDGETKLGEGVLSVHAPIYVYAAGGTVERVDVAENNTVKTGTALFTLAEKPQSASYAEAVARRDDKAKEIAALYALKDNPVLTAPTDGIVASVGAREGTAVNGDAVKMTISVDELDIGVVSLGQNANIMLDAFAGESFSAKVTHISLLGTAAGSITTYSVELTLAQDDRFLEGMNGSAIVVAQQKEGVLLIPVEAIFEDETGVYVYVKTDDGAERREIVTGLSDGVNAEIVSGLEQGDVVQYQGSYVSLIDQYRQMGMMRGGN